MPNQYAVPAALLLFFLFFLRLLFFFLLGRFVLRLYLPDPPGFSFDRSSAVFSPRVPVPLHLFPLLDLRGEVLPLPPPASLTPSGNILGTALLLDRSCRTPAADRSHVRRPRGSVLFTPLHATLILLPGSLWCRRPGCRWRTDGCRGMGCRGRTGGCRRSGCRWWTGGNWPHERLAPLRTPTLVSYGSRPLLDIFSGT